MKLLTLGEKVYDKATDQNGILTLCLINMDHKIQYAFQPARLNETTGKPVKTYWVSKAQIEGYTETETELPLNVLGTSVRDKATGYEGTATEMMIHINGCVHFYVQSPKIMAESGETAEAIELDIRRLEGPEIQVMTKEELQESHKTKPSPEMMPERRAIN